MSIISLIILIVVVGLVAWLVSMLPIPEPYGRLIQYLILIAVVLYVIVFLLRLGGLA